MLDLLCRILLTLGVLGVVCLVLEEFVAERFGRLSKARLYTVKLAGWLFTLAAIDVVVLLLINIWL